MDGLKVVVLALLVKVDTPRSAVSAIGHGFGTRDPKNTQTNKTGNKTRQS